MHHTDLARLTDDALVAGLASLWAEGHAITARVIAHLIEVEDRRLDLRAACTSMFDFCQRRLGMSEGAAFRRMTAARMVKRFPALLARIERGELHLSTLVLLRPHLNEQNVDELAAAAIGKTRSQVELMLARLSPKPDVQSAIVELGTPSNDARPTLFATAASSAATNACSNTPLARIEPLSETRFKVQLTASEELRAKLERARDLMRHRNPDGDLAVVIDTAMDLLLAKLEKERFAKVKTPRAARASAGTSATDAASSRPRAIPAHVRRAVFERDGEQCTFIGNGGGRCPQRGHLELDHIEARALGGTNDASNLRVRCRAHNRLAAEDVFGKAHVAEQIDFRQRKSAATPSNVIELAVSGLRKLGFDKSAARRAVDDVSRQRMRNGDPLDIQDVLRGAIAALT